MKSEAGDGEHELSKAGVVIMGTHCAPADGSTPHGAARDLDGQCGHAAPRGQKRRVGGRGGLLFVCLIVWWAGCVAGNEVYVVGYNDYGQVKTLKRQLPKLSVYELTRALTFENFYQLGLGDYLERSTQTLMREIPLDTTDAVAAGLYHNLVVGSKDGNRGTMCTSLYM
jgi:hypothetical protein